MQRIKIIVVDDHQLFRSGLISVIQQIDPLFEIVGQASNGKELLKLLEGQERPDIVLMDVNMPVMDGFKTLDRLKGIEDRPKVLMLTMLNDDITLIRLLKLGANGFLNKDVEPEELRTALLSISNRGDYFTPDLAGKLVEVIRNPQEKYGNLYGLSEKELEFTRWACSEMSYSEIGEKMFVSKKTVENYRASSFEKVGVNTRIGLVLHALRAGIVHLEELP